MSYQNTAAEFRPELQVKVEEAMAIDDSFVADTVFPIYPVKTRTGFFKKIKRGKGQLLSKAGGADDRDRPAAPRAWHSLPRSDPDHGAALLEHGGPWLGRA